MFRKRCPAPADTFHDYPWTAQDDGFIEVTQRGSPAPLAWWQRRPNNGPRMHAQPSPVQLLSRPYSRGANAYGPKFGYLPWNPIGAGEIVRQGIHPITGPAGRYVFGAIFWGVNNVPTSIAINPTVPVETIDALIANGSVAGWTPTTG